MADKEKRLTSIVILNMNTCGLLRQCIESIRRYTVRGTYELIVVDNGSTDGSVPWIIAQPDIRYIINEKNEGFPKGCNQGMVIAKGTEILLLNSDVIVTPLWLDNMREVLYMDDSVGAVSCVTNYCSNGQQINVPEELRNNVAAIVEFGRKYNEQRPRRISLRSTLVGFCFLFRYELYQQIGELDEIFSPGNYEDDDYSLRILQAGFNLICCEDTFIYHIGSASFVRTPESLRRYKDILAHNEAAFFAKWCVPRDYKSLEPAELKSWLANQPTAGNFHAEPGSSVVVIPVYKASLNQTEKISLTQAVRIWGKKKLAFAAPEGFNPDYGELSSGVRIEHFPAEYFHSVSTYSQLCLVDEFYAAFAEVEYMLIYQLDAFVFADRLAEFCALGLDYIGAPVPRFYRSWHILLNASVGNGGFCLRRIASVRRMIKCKELILQNHPMSAWLLVNEDMFFAYCGKKMYFQVADSSTALSFAVQDDLGHCQRKLKGKLPFGLHGWQLTDKWDTCIEKAGYIMPVNTAKLDIERRREQIDDYLQGRNKINLHYLNIALKWQEPMRALQMVLSWLEKYPQGDKAWRNTAERLMDLWAKCIIEEETAEPAKLYLYEMLEKALGKAYIRSHYAPDNSIFFVLLFGHAKKMLARQKDGILQQEMAMLIQHSISACEAAGYRKNAESCRQAYRKLFVND